jgi:DedD protein
MGLFSFLGKKNQDSSADVSGRFSRPDDEFAERARAKRASHAGGGARRGADDPVLPEKKRARRRLVGAIALALAAAVGLPMLLDSEPKPLAGDIAIQIPAKDKAAPLPVPAAPGASSTVAASDSVDKGEEVVAAPPVKPAAAPAAEASRTVTEVQAAPAKAERPKPVPAAVEHAKPEAAKPEPAHADPATTEHKPARLDAKPEPKDKPKKEDKPAHAAPQDSARAEAILEGKEAARASDAGQKYVLQVIATASQEKAAELQAKLRATGIHSFTEKLHRPQGDLIRVKVGPFSRDEAEKVRSQLSRLGLSGALSPA